jgi:hypothetical protein
LTPADPRNEKGHHHSQIPQAGSIEGESKVKKKRTPKIPMRGAFARCFDDSDLAWLAGRYEEQHATDPDLSIEEFALKFGVETRLLNPFVVKESKVTLWHGTSNYRAVAIVREGFQVMGRTGKRIWFTLKPPEARAIARHRARQREEEPVVFRCEIDLKRYPEYDRPNANHYAFRHGRIERDVIRSIDGLKGIR